ncbi:hypothetical protein [Cohnella sp. 56]|uniref:hypothetical protein n=1 Tax=Cohnella sp. 56 TaxID=3113722 RepID=UPI0030EAB2AB
MMHSTDGLSYSRDTAFDVAGVYVERYFSGRGSSTDSASGRSICFDETPIRAIRYEDALHYIVTKRFLNNRDKVWGELLEE